MSSDSAINARIRRLLTGPDGAQRSRDLMWLWENGEDHSVVDIIRVGRERGDSEADIIDAIRDGRRRRGRPRSRRPDLHCVESWMTPDQLARLDEQRGPMSRSAFVAKMFGS